jgi:hypothetical protein
MRCAKLTKPAVATAVSEWSLAESRRSFSAWNNGDQAAELTLGYLDNLLF